jgi:hypothetical protein
MDTERSLARVWMTTMVLALEWNDPSSTRTEKEVVDGVAEWEEKHFTADDRQRYWATVRGRVEKARKRLVLKEPSKTVKRGDAFAMTGILREPMQYVQRMVRIGVEVTGSSGEEFAALVADMSLLVTQARKGRLLPCVTAYAMVGHMDKVVQYYERVVKVVWEKVRERLGGASDEDIYAMDATPFGFLERLHGQCGKRCRAISLAVGGRLATQIYSHDKEEGSGDATGEVKALDDGAQ